jgi:putative DNA primase/helicase
LLRRHYAEPAGPTLHHQQGTFHFWTGTHYRDAATEEIRARIYGFLDRAQRLVNGKLVPFKPSRTKVADVLDALAAAAQLPSTVDAPAWLSNHALAASDILPCSNGLLHLPTRDLLSHTPLFFGMNAVGYPYDAEASRPELWLTFLKSVWPEDQQSIDTLQELFGLLLTPDTRHQKAFMILGPKRSGKGTIARVLTALLGKENVAAPTLNSLSQNFGLSPLINKQLAIISDARLGNRSDIHVIAERLLSITGEDLLTLDRKYLRAWTGRLPIRFVIFTNELPKLSDVSGALASRFIILRLVQSFYGREDHALTDKLLAELPGILIWAIEGRDRLVERGQFVQPASGEQAVHEMEDLGSPIGAFVRERCDVGPPFSVRPEALYGAWTRWCKQQHRDHPGTVQTFGRDLHAAAPGIIVIKPRDKATGMPVRYYQGIGLKAP